MRKSRQYGFWFCCAALWLLLSAQIHAQTRAPASVRVVSPASTAIHESLILTGSVTAERDAALSPRVSGLVSRVRVDAGDRVKTGVVLMELDSTLAALELAEADAALAQARARLADTERLRDEARRLNAASNIAESQYLSSEARVTMARATVERLLARRRAQAERLARHELVAPFEGVVSRRHTHPGEWVQTGGTVLELVDMDPLRIDAQVPQHYLSRLDARTRVTVRLDAFPRRRYPARIAARVPVTDPDARTFLVRVVLENISDALTPGLSARLRFTLPGARRALLVPRDAVIRYPDASTTVWVVETDSSPVARERPVRLGASRGGRVVVLEGIAADARVVVRGNESLRAGQPVRVLEDG